MRLSPDGVGIVRQGPQDGNRIAASRRQKPSNAQQTSVWLTSRLLTQASSVVQQPASQVALQQPYCFVYGSMTHGTPGPQQLPLHGVLPAGPAGFTVQSEQ